MFHLCEHCKLPMALYRSTEECDDYRCLCLATDLRPTYGFYVRRFKGATRIILERAVERAIVGQSVTKEKV